MFTFTDDALTHCKHTTEAEALALFKLPAEVIAAYFTGIGTMFTAFKTRDAGEIAALTEALKLETLKRKFDACINAYNAGEPTKIAALGCSTP
jgi:hypothetical protein